MITKRQFMILQYYIVRSLFLGIGMSSICGIANTATPFSALLGFILGLLFCLLIYKINAIKGNLTIVEYLDKYKYGIIGKVILFLIATILFFSIILIISILGNSFYLMNTPIMLISMTLFLVIFYATKKGVIPFMRACELLLPLSLAIFIFKSISYGMHADMSNLKPYINAPLIDIVKSTLIYFVYTAAPCIVLLNFKNTHNVIKKKAIWGYVLGSGTIFITLLLITLVIGFPLAGIFRYPEYMIMKKINILNFIVNIENILMIMFIFDNVILGFFLVNLVYDIVKSINSSKIVIKYWNIFYIISLTLLFVYYFYPNYIRVLTLYNYAYIVLLGLLSLFIIYFFVIRKKIISK